MFHRQNLFQLLNILQQPFYLGLTILGALFSYSIYALSFNFSLIYSTALSRDFSLLAGLVPTLVTGFPGSVPLYSLVLAVLISVAIGANMALGAYSFLGSRNLGASDSGALAGLAGTSLAPACTACATGALTFAGFSASVAFLPFNGVEVTVLILVLLVTSAFWIVEKSQSSICQV